MRLPLVSFATLALLLLGCGKKDAASSQPVADSNHGPIDKVISVKDDDAKMNQAIAKARATVQQFVPALQKPKRGQSSFSVKMMFTEGRQHEHMWLDEVTYDGTQFHGVVANDPNLVKNVKIGQKASVEPAKISDWMYTDKGKLVGGYTVRVLRDGLSPDERAQFDMSVPFKID
jgi:uncharacterized protein YegJ (DUF2314 family)